MTFLIAVAVAPLTFLTLCFAVELFVGLPAGRRRPSTYLERGQLAIIVPAHNEEVGLGERLQALKEAVGERARILVVADNCTDLTAETAKSFHVEVIERFDDKHRGKGFALDFAKQHLRAAAPHYVMIIDADCSVDGASVERLVADCAKSGRPCQAIYLLAPDPGGPPNVQLSTFAFYVKNAVRQRGLQRLAGRAHLVGTGMMFPWPLFDGSDLATGNIVEDLELGLDLAKAGFPTKLVDDAVVWSEAATQGNTFDQRRRWEGGYLQSAVTWGPASLGDSLRRGDARGLWAAISLFIPPFALLLLADVVVLALAILAMCANSANKWPPLALGVSILVAIIALFAAWATGGSRFVTLRAIAHAPLYLAWKVPLYLGLAHRGAPKEWLRTGRS